MNKSYGKFLVDAMPSSLPWNSISTAAVAKSLQEAFHYVP